MTVFEPVPDVGEAFRLNALEAKSIDHEPLAGAVTVTVPEPEPYPEILIFVELIVALHDTFSWVDVSTPFTRGKNG